MSYQERQAIVNILSTIVIITFYSAYMIQRFPEGDPYSPDVFHFWGSFFLILIPVTIVAKIIIYILFNIMNAIATQEAEPPITDERDKLIELKSQTIANYVFIFGFVLAMASLVIQMPPSVMFIILLCSGVASDLLTEITKFHFYRNGI